MYKEGDKLTLLQSVGRKNNSNYIEKGSTVEFIKAIDTGDMSKSYVVVKFEDRALTVPEATVKLQEGLLAKVMPYFSAYNKNMRDYNKTLMQHNPRLRIYHHNPVMRVFYKIMYFFSDKLGTSKKKEANLDRIKRIVNGD